MSKPNLLLLHGALGSEKLFDELKPYLTEIYEIHSFNFNGHGGKPVGEDFSIEGFTNDLKNYLDSKRFFDSNIFGYSMGGYVALNLARTDVRISKIMTLGTKFHWSPEIAAHEIKGLNPDKIEEKVPAFAEVLARRHAPENWKKVVTQTATLMTALGENPLLHDDSIKQINQKVLITLGSDDNMVSKEESQYAASKISNADFTLIQNFPHPLEKVEKARLAELMTLFFTS